MTITSGSDPVLLNPTWYQVANGFAQLGTKRLVGAIDDLLLLFCLAIPFRRIKQLAPIIVALAAGE